MCLGIKPMVPENNHCFAAKSCCSKKLITISITPPVPATAYEPSFGADVDPYPPAILAMGLEYLSGPQNTHEKVSLYWDGKVYQ